MFNFFKNKKYPDFWKEYLKTFEQKPSKTIDTTRFVVFDTETTGLDIETDRILSIGAIGVFNNILDVSDNFEHYLKQHEFSAKTVEIHGILKEGKLEKYSENESLKQFLKYIGNSVLVAHHATFDIEMIFITLRSKSVGEGVKLIMKCEVEDCDGSEDVFLELDKITVSNLEESKENKSIK